MVHDMGLVQGGPGTYQGTYVGACISGMGRATRGVIFGFSLFPCPDGRRFGLGEMDICPPARPRKGGGEGGMDRYIKERSGLLIDFFRERRQKKPPRKREKRREQQSEERERERVRAREKGEEAPK